MGKLRILAAALLSLPAVYSQSVTGQISGTVTDSSGGIVQGATVRLTHGATQQVRTFTTEMRGSFVFTNPVPADYGVHIAVAGSHGDEERGVDVTTQDE